MPLFYKFQFGLRNQFSSDGAYNKLTVTPKINCNTHTRDTWVRAPVKNLIGEWVISENEPRPVPIRRHIGEAVYARDALISSPAKINFLAKSEPFSGAKLRERCHQVTRNITGNRVLPAAQLIGSSLFLRVT